MIVKSKMSWWKSCFRLIQSLITLFTLDYVYISNWEIYRRPIKFSKLHFHCYWWLLCFIPEELIEVLTLGYFTWRKNEI